MNMFIDAAALLYGLGHINTICNPIDACNKNTIYL